MPKQYVKDSHTKKSALMLLILCAEHILSNSKKNVAFREELREAITIIKNLHSELA